MVAAALSITLPAFLFGAAWADDSISDQQVRFFELKIRPLLAEHCWDCHGQDAQKGDLRLDSRGAMLAGGESGEAIAPGHPDESLLIEAVRYASYEMPPAGQLDAGQIEVFERWIEMGAPWPGAIDEPIQRKGSQPQWTCWIG